MLDPRHHAVRGDLADLRLADQVFAPHYAAPLPCVATRAADVFPSRDLAGDAIATLNAGDAFEVLEIAGNHAWGLAPREGIVGFVDRCALEIAR